MFYFYTSFFTMFTREAVLKMELKDVSIAKYLKPEAQAEAQAVEEELRNLKLIREKKERETKERKYIVPDEEEQKIYDRLVDIIVQNVVIRDSTIKFLLKSLLKEEVYTIVDTSIQKINQLNEIIYELNSIENQIEDNPDDLTEEEGNKLSLPADYVDYNAIIFGDACRKIEEKLDEFIGNLIEIIIYIKGKTNDSIFGLYKVELIKDITEKISNSIDSKESK